MRRKGRKDGHPPGRTVSPPPVPALSPPAAPAPPPETFAAALFRILWPLPHWLRVLAILAGGLTLLALAVWASLPDEAKQRAIARWFPPSPPNAIVRREPVTPGAKRRIVILTEAANTESTRRLLGIVEGADQNLKTVVDVVPVANGWQPDGPWSTPAPSLIVIHSSVFRYSGAEDHRLELLRFIAGFSKRFPDVRYLVYNSGFLEQNNAKGWLLRARADFSAGNLGSPDIVRKVDTVGFDYRSKVPNFDNAQQIRAKVANSLSGQIAK